MEPNRIVSRDEWLEARVELLAKEKAHTRERDALARERRALPWVRVEKEYVFDGPDGPATLGDLFAGRSQLFVKHFMLGPGQTGWCTGCSLEVDHLQGIVTHLENHDVSYVAVARAPIDEIEVIRSRMDWSWLRWVSSYRNDFNYDFGVSFRPEERGAARDFYNFRRFASPLDDLSGDSVFYRNERGEIFHTYSTFSRGGEEFLGIYRYLDATPKGRDENGPYHSMPDWARPRPFYGKGGTVSGTGRYEMEGCGCASRT